MNFRKKCCFFFFDICLKDDFNEYDKYEDYRQRGDLCVSRNLFKMLTSPFDLYTDFVQKLLIPFSLSTISDSLLCM